MDGKQTTANRQPQTADGFCDLCGLSLRKGIVAYNAPERTYHFCCNGCLQVFRMLSHTSGGPVPDDFKATELFRRCRDLGIIPGSAEDLPVADAPRKALESAPVKPFD